MSNKKLSVFNTLTNKYEDIEVSEEFYNKYRRLGWNEEYRQEKIRENELVFSNLVGNTNNSYENFKEFISYKDEPENLMELKENSKLFEEKLKILTKKQLEVFNLIAIEGLTVKSLSQKLNKSPQNIYKIINKIKDKLEIYTNIKK